MTIQAGSSNPKRRQNNINPKRADHMPDEGTEALLDRLRPFETTTPDGLKRIAAVIEKAWRTASDPRRAPTRCCK